MEYPGHLNNQIVEPVLDVELSPSQDQSGPALNPLADGDKNSLDPKVRQKEASSLWSKFVDEVSKNSNQSLISLLRNSVILNLNNIELVIGYTNSKLFSPEKTEIIERAAKSFFNPSIKVIFRESNDGIDLSLKGKQDIADLKKEQDIRKEASKDVKVKKVLELFPNSKINRIQILEE